MCRVETLLSPSTYPIWLAPCSFTRQELFIRERLSPSFREGTAQHAHEKREVSVFDKKRGRD